MFIDYSLTHVVIKRSLDKRKAYKDFVSISPSFEIFNLRNDWHMGIKKTYSCGTN
jgi:hypothetical protein